MLLLVVMCLQAQAPDVHKSEPPPISLERIRRELEQPAISPATDRTVPVIRVYVNERALMPERVWIDERPSYVRPHQPLYHHEFQESVVPEEFRAATLYPIGVDLVPLIDKAINSVRTAIRDRAEAQARRTVQQELQLLLEARKAAGQRDR
jgi:hypothetical protein